MSGPSSSSGGGAAAVAINSEDVVRIMLQYMKENNLTKTLECLQDEAQVGLNTVDSVEGLLGDIQAGKWDSVLSQISPMRLPNDKLIPLYEQVIFELLENAEKELAREFLRSTECLQSLKTHAPQRYARLEHLCHRAIFNPLDCYEFQVTKETRRADIAAALASEVSVVPSSRLLSLLGQAIKYQQLNGSLQLGGAGAFDLFRGSRRAARKDVDEKVIRRLAGQIKFAPESHPETALFSPDGVSLVTGSVDGFIEVWDYETCKLRTDLEYQAKDELMAHDEAVLCSTFARDAEHLATGSQSGQIKMWKVSTGVCLRKFAQAHPQGITALSFSKDGTQLLSASFDGSLRIHGIKSGKTLKEFRGHGSYVNAASFTRDGQGILSGSSDGTVRIWDTRTSDCLQTVRPGAGLEGGSAQEITVLAVLSVPGTDTFLVVSKSSTAHLLTSQGETIRSYAGGGGDFLCAAVSPQGRWAYCIAEDGLMYVFDVARGSLEETTIVSEKDRECIAINHHPHRNLLVTLADNGQLKLWKA